MTDLRKAAEMALEALAWGKIEDAKEHLSQALAQRKTLAELLAATPVDETPECSDHPDAPHGFNRDASHSLDRYVCDCEGWSPEPVAYWNPDESGLMFKEGRSGNWVPLYSKKKWVGLTGEEVDELAKWADKNAAPWHLEFAKAIERSLKEKNS